MWPFRRSAPPQPDSGDSDRLATLSRRIDDMDAAVRRLGTEWVDTLDRLQRLAGRISKRAERDASPLDAPPPEDTPPAVNGASHAAQLVAMRRNRQTSPVRR